MSAAVPKKLPHTSEVWDGYTLDELRYMRAYTAARIEINKDRIVRNVSALKSGPTGKTEGLLGRMFSTLSYIDIAMLTYKIGSRAFKAVRWLRRK